MIVALLAVSLVLPAHSFYDPSCCGGNDCHPLSDNEVVEAPDGYHWHGMTVPYADRTILLSPDERFHICILPRDPRPRCLYVPRRST